MTDTAGKLRDLASALAWRRAQSGPVVFTNGVFDLVHPGHVELLETARREGSALVVGLNSDVSARRLAKGSGRPVVDQAARARILGAFSAVDCIVLFDEDTPLALIQAISPDVLVKGADYSREQIVGAEWVESHGGRVVRVPLVSGHSTSALVERLRAPS